MPPTIRKRHVVRIDACAVATGPQTTVFQDQPGILGITQELVRQNILILEDAARSDKRRQDARVERRSGGNACHAARSHHMAALIDHRSRPTRRKPFGRDKSGEVLGVLGYDQGRDLTCIQRHRDIVDPLAACRSLEDVGYASICPGT